LSQEQLGHVNGDPAMKDLIAKAVQDEEDRRNQARLEADRLAQADIDKLVQQLRSNDVLTLTGLTYLRASELKTIDWRIVDQNVGMGIASSEIPASEYQAANPIYILLFGLLFSALWAFLGRRGKDPSTPVKFALGLLQLGLGFGFFWYGAEQATDRGMASMVWLLGGWVLITTGELCLSPVGLSMVTKLSPARLVSTVMGGWFLATAFSNYLAAVIATFTGVGHGDEGLQVIPPPSETSQIYGDVFGIIAVTAMGAALLCLLLSWPLNKWMHADVADAEDNPQHS
jgi:POT family proton-dependent oligopeptide transporter